jgi:hypothetical protein
LRCRIKLHRDVHQSEADRAFPYHVWHRDVLAEGGLGLQFSAGIVPGVSRWFCGDAARPQPDVGGRTFFFSSTPAREDLDLLILPAPTKFT